jgi:hypothetical protein
MTLSGRGEFNIAPGPVVQVPMGNNVSLAYPSSPRPITFSGFLSATGVLENHTLVYADPSKPPPDSIMYGKAVLQSARVGDLLQARGWES